MDKYEVRRQQLLYLVDKHADGVRAKFCKLVNLHPATISHLLLPPGSPDKRPITEKRVEYLEQQLSLPPGWFDEPLQSEFVKWPFVSVQFNQFLKLKAADKEEIEVLMCLKVSRLKK